MGRKCPATFGTCGLYSGDAFVVFMGFAFAGYEVRLLVCCVWLIFALADDGMFFFILIVGGGVVS